MNNIYSMRFETTSWNTGHFKSASKNVLLNLFFGQLVSIMYQSCNLIMFCVLQQQKKKSEVKVFKIFKKHWNDIWQQFDGEFVNLLVTYQIFKKCLFCVMIKKSLSKSPQYLGFNLRMVSLFNVQKLFLKLDAKLFMLCKQFCFQNKNQSWKPLV